jgi:hypothetical protein
MVKMKKKTIQQEINQFLVTWDCKQQMAFLRDIIPLFELYDVDDEENWVRDSVGADQENDIRLIRTVYLVSRIAEFHAGRLLRIAFDHKNLWDRMNKNKLMLEEQEHSLHSQTEK